MTGQSTLSLIQQHEEEKNMAGHLSRMTTNQPNTSPKNYLSLVDAYMKEHPDISKAQAMRAITAKHPEAHELWLDSVQKS